MVLKCASHTRAASDIVEVVPSTLPLRCLHTWKSYNYLSARQPASRFQSVSAHNDAGKPETSIRTTPGTDGSSVGIPSFFGGEKQMECWGTLAPGWKPRGLRSQRRHESVPSFDLRSRETWCFGSLLRSFGWRRDELCWDWGTGVQCRTRKAFGKLQPMVQSSAALIKPESATPFRVENFCHLYPG